MTLYVNLMLVKTFIKLAYLVLAMRNNSFICFYERKEKEKSITSSKTDSLKYDATLSHLKS